MSYDKNPSWRAVISGSKYVPDFGCEQPLAANSTTTQITSAIRLYSACWLSFVFFCGRGGIVPVFEYSLNAARSVSRGWWWRSLKVRKTDISTDWVRAPRSLWLQSLSLRIITAGRIARSPALLSDGTSSCHRNVSSSSPYLASRLERRFASGCCHDSLASFASRASRPTAAMSYSSSSSVPRCG